MKNDSGFTLIEAVIFIIVVSMGFWVLSSSYLSIIKKSATGEYLSIAIALCEKKMEETISKPFNKIRKEDLTPFNPPFNSYKYEINPIYVNPYDLNTKIDPNTEYKNVEVCVHHSAINAVCINVIVSDY